MRARLGKRDRDVYRWEDEVLHPGDARCVSPETARSVTSYVWQQRGLSHPPKVVAQARLGGAHANRHTLTMDADGVPTYHVLHELAHSMDFSLEMSMGEYACRVKGESLSGSVHDENWLGIYLDLLSDFMGPKFNKLYLMKTLADRGLTFSMVPVIRCR